MQIDTAHPVLFFADRVSSFSVPSDTSGAFATTTDDCLAFWVLAYVDGATLVTVSDQACDASGLCMFDGTIASSTGIVSVSDSSGFEYINVPVPVGPVSVRLTANHDRHLDWVWLELGAIRSV